MTAPDPMPTIACRTSTSPSAVSRVFAPVIASILTFAIHATPTLAETTATGNEIERAGRCQYSVRDVAFVNVHGKAWQLQLAKPPGTTEKQFEQWNADLRSELANSNAGFIWFDPNSSEAQHLSHNEISGPGLPLMAIIGPDNQPLVIPQLPADSDDTPNDRPFQHWLRTFTQSPHRKMIRDRVTSSLCVLVLVKSGTGAQDQAAQKQLEDAILRVDQQMWTLEKPTDAGPASVIIDADQVADEGWLLASLGIDPTRLPAVAVVFGQNRRLGEVLSGTQLTADEIVKRAVVCGQDCECDLDREWLYGHQMIHVWNQEDERTAEQSLDFDPKSAFVIAEVAQIIQKNARSSAPPQNIRLGNGLIIHDLDNIEPRDAAPPKLQDAAPPKPQTQTPANSLATQPPSQQPLTLRPQWSLLGRLLGIFAILAILILLAMAFSGSKES